MPFSGNTYTPPTGAESAAPGQVLQSATWNAIFTDLAAALTLLATQANTTPTWSNIMAPNGGFAVWQRGAGLTASIAVAASTTAYTADRWYLATGALQACTVSAQVGLTAAVQPAHAGKVQRTAGQTGITSITFGYPFTLSEVERMRSQMVSLSAAAKAGANWSPALGAFAINLYVGTGTAGKRGGGFTNETNPFSMTVDLAAGATNTAITGTSANAVAATSTQGELQITWTPVGTAGVDDSITFDQFCLVAGSIVQAFEDIPFDIALIECKKFFRKSFPYNTAPAQNAGLPGAVATVAQAATKLGFYVQFEAVEMHATASFTSYNPSGNSANWIDNTAGTSIAASFDTVAPSAKGVLIIGATVTAANDVLFIHYSADAGL